MRDTGVKQIRSPVKGKQNRAKEGATPSESQGSVISFLVVASLEVSWESSSSPLLAYRRNRVKCLDLPHLPVPI